MSEEFILKVCKSFRRGLRHFGECWARLGYGPAPGPTIKKALCNTCLFGGAVNKYRCLLVVVCFSLINYWVLWDNFVVFDVWLFGFSYYVIDLLSYGWLDL